MGENDMEKKSQLKPFIPEKKKSMIILNIHTHISFMIPVFISVLNVFQYKTSCWNKNLNMELYLNCQSYLT